MSWGTLLLESNWVLSFSIKEIYAIFNSKNQIYFFVLKIHKDILTSLYLKNKED